MTQAVRIGFTEREWFILNMVSSSFALMLNDFLEAKQLKIPQEMNRAFQLPGTAFADDFDSAGNRLRIYAIDVLGEQVSDAGSLDRNPPPAEEPLIFAILHKYEFSLFWIAWRGMVQLLSQEMNGDELKFPTRDLPPDDKQRSEFAHGYSHVIAKIPVPMERWIQ